jgi:murein DD-endopeptidase MepM/ murein hydrolase activator NlpD
MSIILPMIIYLQFHVFLPIKYYEKSEIKLTNIGTFGLLRKARPNVPQHYHTGIDIIRPNKNYSDEPIFSLADGIVISKRDDGPYAQIIIEHSQNGFKFWTLYEHIAGITIHINEKVKSNTPIARFMNTEELKKYGRQFDHFHLEILKIRPKPMKPDKLHPERYYSSYSLVCYKKADLDKYYYEPLSFLKKYYSIKQYSD